MVIYKNIYDYYDNMWINTCCGFGDCSATFHRKSWRKIEGSLKDELVPKKEIKQGRN